MERVDPHNKGIGCSTFIFADPLQDTVSIEQFLVFLEAALPYRFTNVEWQKGKNNQKAIRFDVEEHERS